MGSIVFNMDCMDVMKTFKDKEFDIAFVDPPYGKEIATASITAFYDDIETENVQLNHKAGNISWRTRKAGSRIHRGDRVSKYKRQNVKELKEKKRLENKIKDWDISPPKEYFRELERISKNQIIFGGNYFPLPPTRCCIAWYKKFGRNWSMSDFELAWTSFQDKNSVSFAIAPQDKDRFHPTQKPLKLYKMILLHFAKPGMKIFDSHLGSGTTRLACYELGFDFVGCEIDKDYYRKAEERFEEFKTSPFLFNEDFQDENNQDVEVYNSLSLY